MSDVEKKSETQEAAPKKKPYNLRDVYKRQRKSIFDAANKTKIIIERHSNEEFSLCFGRCV